MYWATYGTFLLAEKSLGSLLRDIPYYYHLRFGFLVWLMSSSSQGARRCYDRVLRRVFSRYETKIDTCLVNLHHISAGIYAAYKIPLDAAYAASLAAVNSAVYFCKWFTSSGDDISSRGGGNRQNFLMG